MAVETATSKTEDSVKRGKMITLSVLMGLTMFIQTLIKSQDMTVTRVLTTAAVYFIVSFLGLIWAFNFQVKIKSLPYLVYSALFVMSEYLFIQLFFVEKFSRIYQGLFLFILILLVSIGSYISFLMTNVFNVNLYKNIPLAEVGKTTSYIISTLSIYFLTFALLSLQLPIYFLLPIEFGILWFFAFIHLRNIGFEGFVLKRKAILVSLIVFFMFLATLFTGVLHEVSALSPAVGYFVAIGIANMRVDNTRFNFSLILYILALIAVIILNFILNIFS